MPMQLGRLKCLQTLTKLIISKHNGAYIEELGKLTNLRGTLSILELQNVASCTDAMKDSKHLDELVLEWNAFDNNISEYQKYVLENLHPHSSLKGLVINNYGAESLPDWVGHHSFSNIMSLLLEDYRSGTSLSSSTCQKRGCLPPFLL
jgi:hypothetical protein